MKTSKITEVIKVSEWMNPKTNKLTYYHHLVMENGDKIDIGKLSKMEVGTEMNYEITSTQYEFNKARAVWNQGGYNSNSFNKDPKTQNKIDYFAAYQRACLYFIMKGHKATDIELDNQINSIISKASGQTEEINKTVKEELDGRKEMDVQDNNDNDLPF